MAVTHATIKAPGQRVFAITDWNEGHVIDGNTGEILFREAGGTIGTDSNLVWDDINKVLTNSGDTIFGTNSANYVKLLDDVELIFGTAADAGIKYNQGTDTWEFEQGQSNKHIEFYVNKGGAAKTLVMRLEGDTADVNINNNLTVEKNLTVNGISYFGNWGVNYASFSTDGNLSFTGTAVYKVGANQAAFEYAGDSDIKLQFSTVTGGYEFRRSDGVPNLWIGAGTLAATRRVGIGTTAPNIRLQVVGGISSASTTINASSDAFDVAEVNILYVDTSGGAVVIGGFANGVAGQVLHVVRIDAANNLTLEHFEAAGTQKLIMFNGADKTIGSYGGWTLVFNGTYWIDASV